MATLTYVHKSRLDDSVFIKKRDQSVKRLLPRRCMVVSIGLCLAGLGVPMLMAVHLVPVTWLTSFIGFALVASGGVMAFIFCGEI
jgi:hypothetical protein